MRAAKAVAWAAQGERQRADEHRDIAVDIFRRWSLPWMEADAFVT